MAHKVLKSCRSKMATLEHEMYRDHEHEHEMEHEIADVCDVHGASSLYKNMLAKFIQGFPYWWDGGVPPPIKNLLIHPLPTKFLFPPRKTQFNPIKK